MSARVEPVEPGGVVDDPQDCPACVAAGDLCLFHEGFALGWDACAELVARMVTGDE